jgi:DNA-binding MarR family transcriptional regulator
MRSHGYVKLDAGASIDMVTGMAKAPNEAVVSAWIALMRAQQAALLKIERAFREARLPSLTWYDALWELERAGEEGLRPFEIEGRILIAQSNISRLIDRLEVEGYVERRRCADDGRGQHAAITPAGREMRRRMWPVYAKAIGAAIGDHVSEREAATLATLLAKLADRRSEA